MVAQNLTKADFRIYIQDPNKILNDIFWETCSGLGMTSEAVKTSNGRRIYQMAGKMTPKPVTLSKAANPEEDRLVLQWLNAPCQQTPVMENLESSGSILICLPLRPCVQYEPYNQKVKAYGLMPFEYTFWEADLLAEGDTSRFEIQCNYVMLDYD